MRAWGILLAVVAVAIGLAAASLLARHFWIGTTDQPSTILKTDVNAAPFQAAKNKSAHQSAAVTGPVWFREVAESGITFQHQTGTSPEKPFPAANGSGIAVLDFDLDGGLDLYFATGTAFPVDLSRSQPINRIYRQAGRWQYQEATTATGLGFNGYSAGVAVADYDNDGFPDVYVTCYGANVLFHNQGDGTFERHEQAAGVDDQRWATSAAFFDANNDGLSDLYVCNYGKWSLETNQYCGDRQRGIRLYCSPNSIEPDHDVFYLNQGDGTFRDATAEVGLDVKPGRGQGVVAADLNSDGWTDIYVGNDLTPNFLFLNNGDGTYRDVSEISATAYDYRGQRQAGMGVDSADVNGDGRFDLFVTNFEHEHNTLYENISGDLFQDSSKRYNLFASSVPWVGWGAMFADFDSDSWLDLIITNGHVDDNRHLLGHETTYTQPALLYRNLKGKRFESLELHGGEYFARQHVGRALALADFDGDRDVDVVIGHQDAAPALLENVISSGNTVSVRLIGTKTNRTAIGSSVIARAADRQLHSQIKGGGSYLSASDVEQSFAVPEGSELLELEIRWLGGVTSQLTAERGKRYMVWEPVSPGAKLRWIELP